MLKKTSVLLLTVLFITALMAATLSCRDPADSVSRSIILVKMISFRTGEYERASSGVIFNDETRALAMIDYEKYSQDSIIIVTGDNRTYEAAIEAMDPRSGLAILKTQKAMSLPPVPTGELPGKEKSMVIWRYDWQGMLVSQSVNATPPIVEPPWFQLRSNLFLGPEVDTGTVVIDKDGKVTGLVIPYINSPVHAPTPSGPPAIIAGVTEVQKMLSGEYVRESWASGPAVISLASAVAHRGILMTPDEYEWSSHLIATIMERLGEPVTATDFAVTHGTWSIRPDNHTVIALYTRPMELRNTEGRVLAEAKWIAIEWDRVDSLPDRLIYGTIPFETEGAFEITGNITDFEEMVSSIVDKSD